MTTLPDTTEETTETIEIEETEEEALVIEEENKGISYIITLICCHNTIDTINAILPSPIATFGDVGVYPRLDSSCVYYALPYVFPHFDSANPQHLEPHVCSPTLTIAGTNLVPNACSPTLNISVVKTP